MSETVSGFECQLIRLNPINLLYDSIPSLYVDALVHAAQNKPNCVHFHLIIVTTSTSRPFEQACLNLVIEPT